MASPVVFITGASRGIGKQLAVDFAEHGYDIVAAARSTADSPTKLPGTVDETAALVEAQGQALGFALGDLAGGADQQRRTGTGLVEHGLLGSELHQGGLGADAPGEVPVEDAVGVGEGLAGNRPGFQSAEYFVPGHAAGQHGCRAGSLGTDQK